MSPFGKKNHMLNVTEALRARYTCRDFRPTPVLKSVLAEVLEEATRAPSTANTQPWEIYAATGKPLERIRTGFLRDFEKGVAPNPDIPFSRHWPEPLKRRAEEMMALHRLKSTNHPGESTDVREHQRRNFAFFGAPVVLYLCLDKTLGMWSFFDLGLLAQSIMLAALEQDLDTATALMLVSYPDLIRDELEIPKHLSVAIGIALGYGKNPGHHDEFLSPRRVLADAVRFKGFDSEV